VYVDPVATNQGPTQWSLGSVHFTPCAHTAWHHHTHGQTLFVTEGEGYVQARGGALVPIRPGDVVRIGPGEEHWHGTGPEAPMAHLVVSVGETTFLEPSDGPPARGGA
jgi:quercetin dioxygenase-like cupin family protein